MMLQVLIPLFGYMSLLSFLGIVCVCGDPDDDDCLGRSNYVLTNWIPGKLQNVVKKIPFCGPKLANSASFLQDYICNRPNPLLQLFYLLLVVGGYIIYLFKAYHLIPNIYMASYHRPLAHVIMIVLLTTFTVASTADPGVIHDKASFDKHNNFEFDNFLYVKRECSTCKIIKIPRSKHCRICGHCVSKFDHHCPWINTCVGENNYRYFLLFIGTTSAFLLYASWAISSILLAVVQHRELYKQSYINRTTGEKVPTGHLVVFQIMMQSHGLLMMLLCIASVMGVVMVGFLMYHFLLVHWGVTTNENSKWENVKNFYKKLIAHRAKKEEYIVNIYSDPEANKELIEKHEKEQAEKKKNKKPGLAPLEERESDDFPEEIPPNVYNLGTVSNFKQVLFPLCARAPAPTKPESKSKKSKSKSKKQ